MLEFALCCLVIMPMLLGLCGGGVAMIREIELTQVARDAGHMYANGIDFTQAANQNLVIRIAGALNYVQPHPAGGIYLSTVMYVTQGACQAGGFPNGCANQGTFVITRQLVIGAPGPSSIGYAYAPDSTGHVAEANYLNNTKAQTAWMSTSIVNLWTAQSQTQGVAYFAESSVQNTDLMWTGTVPQWKSAWAVF